MIRFYGLTILAVLLCAGELSAQEAVLRNTLGMEMRLVREGQYLRGYTQYRKNIDVFRQDHGMGNANNGEEPAHVTFITQPFHLGSTEVTVGQFRAFVAASGYVTTAEKHGEGIAGWHNVLDEKEPRLKRRFKRLPTFSWKSPGFEQTDNHPVVGVSWKDAQAFCTWLSEKEGATYRLPTEAEWEFACRAGTDTFYSFGDQHRETINGFANHADHTLEAAHESTAARRWHLTAPGDGVVFTSEVGQFKPNPWGFHDMHGNVWELCQDVYLETYYNNWKRPNNQTPNGRATDPVNTDEVWNADGDWRAIRGGSWINSPVKCRSSYRSFFEANDGACYLGFRVAQDAEGPLVDQARQKHEAYEAALATLKADPAIRWETADYSDHSLKMRINADEARDFAAHLPLMSRVSYFESSGSVSAEVLTGIGQLKQLRKLNLYRPGPELPLEAYEPLAGLAKLESLEFGISNETPALLSRFACLENLRTLGLGNQKTTSAEFEAFAGRRWPNLRALWIDHMKSDGTELQWFANAPLSNVRLNSLTDEGAKQLGRFTNLVNLTVFHPEITGAGLAELAGLSKLKSLRLTGLKDLDDADFAPLAELTGLDSLELGGSGAGDRTAALLSKIPRLRTLRIGSPALTDEGMKHIGGLASVNKLGIERDAAVTDAGLEHLWAANRATVLYLQPPGITGSGFSSLAENMTSLEHIEIWSGDLTDAGLRHLGYLPKLRSLKLYGEGGKEMSAITRQGLLDLAEAPRLTTLEFRKGGTLTDADFAAIKAKKPNLEIKR